MPTTTTPAPNMTPEMILRLRRRLHLTQEGFAQRLNVTRRTVYRWEQGLSIPHPMFVKLMQGMF